MQTTALLAGVENHRVGRVAGDDGLAKIVRTFHARFGSVKTGAGQTPRQRIAYVRREGRHAVDAADVEATAGDKEKVLDAADRLEAGARIRRGPTADRLLATQVIELPAESTPDQRAACAQAFVDDWRERGHPAIATVHVHGEERGQPHLHVEIAARPVHADGEVDRAVRLWRGKPTIYAERQKASDLVNRTCDPDPPYHPGGFRDIGREGDTPKKRIPARSFRNARAGIREAREALALEQAEMIDGAARVVSEAKRAPLREAHEKRTAEIVKFKKAGEWPPLSQRARLEKRAETSRVASDIWYRRYKKSEAGEVDRTAERDQERERGDTAEASVVTLKAEKQKAEGRARELEALNKRQTKYVTNWHANRKVVLPNLATVEGQSAAWANMWAWDAKALKKARDEAGAARTAATTAEKERNEQRLRAEKAEGERDGLQDRVRALEELNKTQTKYVTDWHTDHKEELPDLATVEGQSAAWTNMRAWKAAELKKAEDAVAAKEAAEEALEDERARADRAEMIAAATRVAGEHTRAELQAGAATLKAEKQKAEADAAKAEKEKIEAQPVPDAVPKPLDLPAAWTLPVDELIKAGDVVARKAEVTWGAADSSPTAMPLDGIAGSPVLTFTPEHGLLRKKPATWRYEDTGRYAGKAAIEIEQPDITDRNLDWPNWRAAGEALSRALVTDALEDGVETPRWLEEQFPDLDAEYGPKIRTREYHGEHARTYVGEMSGGQPHGAGTTTWKSGDRYEGAFENGHRHGQGVYDYPDGRRYEGQFENGERTGTGVETWPSGGRYEGAFENGHRHGQGVYDYPDGSRYEGGWRKGERHGPGIEIAADGQRAEGVWKDGKRAEAEPKKTQTRYRGPEM